MFASVHLWLGNSTVHARWLLVHEGYRLALFVFALLLSTQVAQGLDVLLLGFKLLLQTPLPAANGCVATTCAIVSAFCRTSSRTHRLMVDLGRLQELHANLGLCFGLLLSNSGLLSFIYFCLVSEVGRVPGFLIQEVVAPGCTQALRVVARRVLTCVFDYLGCFCISSDACTTAQQKCSAKQMRRKRSAKQYRQSKGD